MWMARAETGRAQRTAALASCPPAGAPLAALPGGGEGSSAALRVPALEGDFSLNAANALSADLLLRSGLGRLAPTHDCNADQIQRMARTLGALSSACSSL